MQHSIDTLLLAIKDEADFVTCSTAARLCNLADPGGGWMRGEEPNRQKVHALVFGKWDGSKYYPSPHKHLFTLQPRQPGKTVKFKLKGGLHGGVTGGYAGGVTLVPQKHGSRPGVTPTVDPLVNYEIHYTDYFFNSDTVIEGGHPLGNGWYRIKKEGLITYLEDRANLERGALTLTYANHKEKGPQGAAVVQIGITQRFKTRREQLITIHLIYELLQLKLRIVGWSLRPKTERTITHAATPDKMVEDKQTEAGPSKGEEYRHTWDDRSDPGKLEALAPEDLELHLAGRRGLLNKAKDPNKSFHDIGPLALSAEAEEILQSQLLLGVREELNHIRGSMLVFAKGMDEHMILINKLQDVAETMKEARGTPTTEPKKAEGGILVKLSKDNPGEIEYIESFK